MSQASSSKTHKYGAFLSFRGPDTRKTFVSHLYNALTQRGIDVFKDDERLKTGKSIPDELLKAIEESKFAIVIFSESYASSRWCLEELAHIIKCRNELNQIVIPMFYNVSPSDVSHQNPPFSESFSQHEKKYKDDMKKVQKWRDAFAEAGKISGYHILQNYKDEADCIKKVVDDILPKVISPISESLVGTQMSLLRMESDGSDVRSVAIRRMGGIGKIEIAYNCCIRMTGIDHSSLSNSPILFDGGKLSLSLDNKTGKQCFMVAAWELGIAWGNTPEYWEWSYHPDSRFSVVAKLKCVCWLDIRGKIQTRILSKNTIYAAYLVFKLEDGFSGLGTANAVVRFVDFESDNDAEKRATVVCFSGRKPRAILPMRRSDGWMELRIGSFVNDTGEHGDVDARLTEIRHLNWKRGLIVQGMEFRPE